MKVIDIINKKYGEGAALLLSEESDKYFSVIPTGSLRLDIALGIGGLPRGRITEIYGPESSGKTTLCQHVIAEAQKMGGVAAFVDTEHALDPFWAQVCGIDLDNLVLSQPDSAEQALDILELYVKSKEVDLVVLDSVAALAPRAEIEGEFGDAHMALVARLMSQSMRRLSSCVSESDCAVLFTNQLRANIGAMGYGPTEIPTGGNALKYYASVRLDIRKAEQVKVQDEVVANKVKVTVKKNKVSPPFKITEFEIDYQSGISRLSEIIELGIQLGLIEKGGPWFTLEGQKIQGSAGLKDKLREDIALALTLENKIREHYRLPLRFER